MSASEALNARRGLAPGPAVLALAGWVLVGGTVVLPQLATGTWTPRLALLLLLVGPGAVSLVAQAASPDPAARMALAYLVIGVVAAALTDRPVLAWWGPYLVGTGVIFIIGTTGAWSLGRRAGPQFGRLLSGTILLVAFANVAVAVVERTVGLRGYVFAHESGRPPGLVGNPVFLGALAAGAFTLLVGLVATGRVPSSAVETAAPAQRRRLVAGTFGLVVLGLGVQVSGSRVALVVAALAAAVAARSGSSRWRRILPPGALLAGVLLAGFLPAAAGPVARGGTERLATTSSAFGPRLDAWRAGLEALGRRPALGWGPGGFRTATSPDRTIRTVRENGAEGYFRDAHNLIVEVGVGTGLLGLGASVAWLILAGRGARGPLKGFAVAVGACTLVQPQQVYLMPLAALALGAADLRCRPAASRTAPPPRASAMGRAALVVAMVAGLVAGAFGAGRLLAGDWELGHGIRRRSASAVRRAEALLPPWPEVTIQRWRILGGRGLGGDRRAARATIVAAERAVRRDPADPIAWNALGAAELEFGDRIRARQAYRRALALDPWSLRAMLGLQRLAVAGGEQAEAARWQRRACRIGPGPCRLARDLARDPVRVPPGRPVRP